MFIYPPGYNFKRFLLFDRLLNPVEWGRYYFVLSDSVETTTYLPVALKPILTLFFHQMFAFIVLYVTGSR